MTSTNMRQHVSCPLRLQDGDNGSVEGSGKGIKRARLSEGSEEGDDMSQDEGEEEEGESGEDEEGEDEEEDEGEDGLDEEDGEGGAKGKKHEAQKKVCAGACAEEGVHVIDGAGGVHMTLAGAALCVCQKR